MNQKVESNPIRINYIDIAKGVAILLVVFGHILCYDLYEFEHAFEQSKLCKFIYTFHLPLFVFLSGLVSITTIEIKKIPQDIWKRFRTVLVPGLIVGGCYSWLTQNNFSFIFDQFKFGYWYLWVLFFLYLINYIIAIGLKKTKAPIVYSVTLILWGLSKLLIKNVPQTITDILCLQLLINVFPYYVLGNAIKKFNLHDTIFCNSWIFIGCVFIWIMTPMLPMKSSNYITATAAIIIVVHICRVFETCDTEKSIAILKTIGKYSLYIYIFHFFALLGLQTSVFSDILCKYSNFGWDFLICIIPVSICVMFSLGIGKIIETNTLLKKILVGKK